LIRDSLYTYPYPYSSGKKTPRESGGFYLAVLAVCCEPVSVKISLFYGENTGNLKPVHPLSEHQIIQYHRIYGFLTREFFGFFSGTGNYQGIVHQQLKR
jgi:hypothetical protein